MSSRGFLQKPINIYVTDEDEVVLPVTPESEIKKSEPIQEDWEKNFNSIFNTDIESPKKPDEKIPEIVEVVEETLPPPPTFEPIEEPIVEQNQSIIESEPITQEPIIEEKQPLVEPIHEPVIEEKHTIIEPVTPIEEPKEKVLKYWGKPDGWNKSSKQPLFQRPSDWSSKPKRNRNSIFKILYWGATNQGMDAGDQYRYDSFMMNFKIGLIIGLGMFLLLLIFFKSGPTVASYDESYHSGGYKNNDYFNKAINWFVEKYFKK